MNFESESFGLRYTVDCSRKSLNVGETRVDSNECKWYQTGGGAGELMIRRRGPMQMLLAS